jgi:hypothetical protein
MFEPGSRSDSSAIGMHKGQCYSAKPTTFNPINLVEKWNAILIIKEKDFVPIGQGQEAFQAAQLRGIKVDFIFSKKTIGF